MSGRPLPSRLQTLWLVHCVSNTGGALFAPGFYTRCMSQGIDVRLILPVCRGVNLNPDDVSHAIAEMKAAGAIVVES